MSRKVVGSMSEWSGLLKDLFRQIDDGSIKSTNLRNFLEHKNPFEVNWIQRIIQQELQSHFNFFGQEFDLAEFQGTLKGYGQKRIEEWKELGLEPHFFPPVVMSQDANFPGWKVKPNEQYYDWVKKGKILRNINGRMEVDKEPYRLEGITVLIDTRLKPNYDGGKQMWENDNLLGPIIEELRKDEKIEDFNSQSSRFNTSANECEKEVKPLLAEKLGLKEIRSERAIEANVIPQIYLHMPRKDDDQTNTWVWYEEYFKDVVDRLYGGDCAYGGLAHVRYDWSDSHWDFGSFRFLAVL